MIRDLTAGVVSEVTGASTRAAWLAFFDFPGGALYAWTGVGNFVWDSNTFIGVGNLGGVKLASEVKNGLSSGATFTLLGLDAAQVALALTENYTSRACKVWLAFFDDAGALIPDPVCMFAGRMSAMSPSKDPQNPAITLEAERGDYDPRPYGSLQSNADQQRRFPGDRGYEYAAALEETRLAWGNPSVGPSRLRASSIPTG